MLPRIALSGLALLLLAAHAGNTAQAPRARSRASVVPAGLRCEYLRNPLGIDAARPRLSWTLEAARPEERALRQTAYRILAASTPERLEEGRADLWDSGKVKSAAALHVEYAGKGLESGKRVYWSVRAWDQRDRASAYSEPSWWEMGLLQPGDWAATWIGHDRPQPATEAAWFEDLPAPLLRREFVARKRVARARAYVSGLGYYELYLNGRRVGDHVLDPGWTEYGKRVLYSTYDITGMVKEGPNAVGAMLGNGWYNPTPLRLFGRFNLRSALTVGPPRLIARLEIEYADGSRDHVVTDPSWRTAEGPVLRNSEYLGEHYDARREQPGWDRPGFDDGAWRPAVRVTEPVGPLRAQVVPPIKVARTLRAAKLTEPKPGVFIFDLGQNFAGWATLRARGPAGTKVTLRFGELLNADGTLNPMTSVAGQIKGRPNAAGAPPVAWQTDSYVLKGSAEEEVFTPRFTFHGFRYVEVTGYPGRPRPEAVEGHLLHSAVEPAGSFSCSNPLLNRIQETVLWTQLSNMFSVQSDCPHREKLGYGGDIVAASEMGLLNFDMAGFYGKAVHDFADSVRPNGGFTETAPYVGIADESLGDGAGPVGWGTAHPLLVAQLHQYYGERRLMEEQYPAVVRWLELLRSRAKEGILDNGISDHESLVPKPRALTGTAFYYYNAALAARMARVLGKKEEAARWEALAASVKDAFNRRFLKPGTGQYDTGTQACQAFALFFGLVPPAEREAALRVLTEDLRTRGNHLSTGIFGTKYLLLSLTELGRPDMAYALAAQTTFPSWGHMLERGATTLWEHWEFSDNTYSHNHPMFGTVSEWFYKGLGGIQPHPEAVGFDRIVVRPQVVEGLEWVKTSYRSVRGPVRSEWRRESGGVRFTLEVPPNAVASVSLPAAAADRVTEGGKPAGRVPGVKLTGANGGRVEYEVGSGRYEFVVR